MVTTFDFESQPEIDAIGHFNLNETKPPLHVDVPNFRYVENIDVSLTEIFL
jgi:hypothetical protein